MRLSELFGEDCEVFVQGEEDEIDDPVDASDTFQSKSLQSFRFNG